MSEAMTEATTEAMTEAMTHAMTEATTEAMTEAMTHATTEAMTEAMTHATTEPATEVAPAGITISTANSDFGEILFDTTGQAIYLFDKETSTAPDCYDKCAVAWPPVITDGAPVAMAGVSAQLLGTASRSDGTLQVTYAGHPLYYFAGEGKKEVTCHDVVEFGGRWLVVTPGGSAAA